MIHYKIKINLSDIGLFVIFWSYGLNSAGSHPSFGLIGNLLLTSLVGFLVLILGYFRKEMYYKNEISFKNKEILYLILLGVVLIILQWSHLNNDLVWDQQAHYRSTNIFGIKALPYLDKALKIELSAQTILYFINIFLLLFCLLIFYIYFKVPDNYKPFYILFLIITLRISAIILTGGNGEPYPPFRTFPIAIGSAFLGGGSFSARSSSLVVFFISLITVYSIIRKKLNFITSLLFIFIFISINLILQVSSMVEQSIWSLAILVPFLIRLVSEENITYKEHLFWIFILSISSLIRTPLFIVLPMYIIYLNFSNKYVIREKIKLILPTLIVIPFYVQLLIFGSNAFYRKGDNGIIPFEDITLMRFKFALAEGIALNLWLYYLPIIIVIAYLISPIIFFFVRKKLFLLISSIQILMLYQFFSIRVDHWGVDRYQIEYIVPFSILTIYLITVKFSQYKLFIANLTLILITLLNIFLPNKHFISEKNYDIKTTIEQLYDITDSIKWAVSNYDPSRVVVLSVTYGESPFINSGLTWSEINKLIVRRNDFIGTSEFTYPGIDVINKLSNNKDVDVILLGDCPWDKDGLLSSLIQNGWRKVVVFKNKKSGNEVIALEKYKSSKVIYP